MRKDREMPKKFGEKLRFLRKKNNFSLKDMERMTGVHSSYIHKIEKGKRRCPSYPVIEKIAFALGENVGDLIDNDLQNDSLKSIQEVLVSTDYLINGNVPTVTERKALVKIVDIILQAEWTETSMPVDSVDIISEVNRLLKSLYWSKRRKELHTVSFFPKKGGNI